MCEQVRTQAGDWLAATRAINADRPSTRPLLGWGVCEQIGMDVATSGLRRVTNWSTATGRGSWPASGVDLMTTGDRKRVKTSSDPTCSWMSSDNTMSRCDGLGNVSDPVADEGNGRCDLQRLTAGAPHAPKLSRRPTAPEMIRTSVASARNAADRTAFHPRQLCRIPQPRPALLTWPEGDVWKGDPHAALRSGVT